MITALSLDTSPRNTHALTACNPLVSAGGAQLQRSEGGRASPRVQVRQGAGRSPREEAQRLVLQLECRHARLQRRHRAQQQLQHVGRHLAAVAPVAAGLGRALVGAEAALEVVETLPQVCGRCAVLAEPAVGRAPRERAAQHLAPAAAVRGRRRRGAVGTRLLQPRVRCGGRRAGHVAVRGRILVHARRGGRVDGGEARRLLVGRRVVAVARALEARAQRQRSVSGAAVAVEDFGGAHAVEAVVLDVLLQVGRHHRLVAVRTHRRKLGAELRRVHGHVLPLHLLLAHLACDRQIPLAHLHVLGHLTDRAAPGAAFGAVGAHNAKHGNLVRLLSQGQELGMVNRRRALGHWALGGRARKRHDALPAVLVVAP
eukprot:Rhum_TRINITY_DN20954_c0_g1::Rhum_TRINITY_DN20954_c0_g1_i1::g.172688::m.172688